MKKLRLLLPILFLFSFTIGYGQTTITGPVEGCVGNLYSFIIDHTLTGATITYSWYDQVGVTIESGTATNNTVFGSFNQIGFYLLEIEVTDSGGTVEFAEYAIAISNCPQIVITTNCDYVYLCVEGYDQSEVAYLQWTIDGIEYPIDTTSNCIEIFGLFAGTHDVQVALIDWMGEPILFDQPNGEILPYLEDFFFTDFGEPLFLFSDASNFCPGGQTGSGCEKVCEFTTVNYYVEIQGNPGTSYWWDVIGAESWTEISWGQIEVVWGAAGTGQVTVYPEQSGCSQEASICVEILESPEASFTTMPDAVANQLNICQGQEIIFDNTSTGAVYYEWSFGDGNVTSEANPEHTYDSPGSYLISLVAKNECLCADTTELQVVVEPTLAPFVDCVGTICGIDTFTYTSDADCADFLWTISANGNVTAGGGVGDNYIAIEWLSGPIGNIELSVENCNGSYCTSPAMIQIPIMTGDAEIVGATEVCKGAAENYKIQGYSATYYSWSITSGQIISGQGTNEVSVVWDSPNSLPTNAQISVDYENCYLECSGQDVHNVRIVDEFLVAGPIEVCPDAVETFTTIKIFGAGKVMSNWNLYDAAGTNIWNFNNAETTNIPFPSQPGMYQLIVDAVTNVDYCKPSYEIVINVIDKTDPPTGIEGELSICPGATYQYEALTASPDFEFNWTITDGIDIRQKTGNPVSVTWNSAGPFELAVTQTDFGHLPCESDAYTQTINAVSVLQLTGPSEACDQDISHFVATYIEYTDYTWEIVPADAGVFVGEDNKSEIDIQWYGGQAAEVRVSLCGLSASSAMTVHPLPEPTVTHPFELCANLTGQVEVDAVFDSYTWYDTSRIVVSNVDKPDLFPGTYELVVTDVNGCTGNTSFTIESLPVPNIRISSPNDLGICLTALHTFPVIFALDSDAGYTYVWYKDGVVMAGEVGPILSTTEIGLYEVEVTDVKGCKNRSNQINVFDWCDPVNGGTCNGGTCNLDYCDNPGGTAHFSFLQGAQCNTYDFTNLSLDFEPGTTSWNFGDEAVFDDVSTDENPSYTFSNAGFYTVLLQNRVDDLDNPGTTCKLWNAQVIQVDAAAHFDVDRACPGEVVQFYDLSTFIPGLDIVSWAWEFGDPTSVDNTSTSQDPTHVFDDPGTYEITLTISTGTCTSTFKDNITIHPKPVVEITPPDVTCAATSVEFENLSAGYIVDWVWNFGDPSSMDLNTASVSTAYHEFAAPGIYDVTLDAENIYGCTERFTIQVEIEPNDLVGDITSDNVNPMCEGETALLTAPAGGVSWEWSTGASSDAISVMEEDIYSVTVTNIDGCSYIPDDFILTLLPKPSGTVRGIVQDQYGQPLDYIYDQMDVCEGEDVFIEAILNADYSYSWLSGELGNEIEYSEDRGNLLGVGTHDFSVVITNNTTGCTNTVGPFTVEVHALPADVVVSASPSGTLCAGDMTTLTVTNVDAALTYIWSNGATGTSIDVSMAGDYYVIAINNFGCQKESNHVEIMSAPDIGLIPDGCLEQCNPDTLCLPAIPNISTFQWYFNGTAIPGPEGQTSDLIAENSGVYYVELVDIFGCTATSDPLTLELIDAVGTVEGTIYYDVNMNGIIDGPDTLMQDVGVILEGVTDTYTTITDQVGEYQFLGVPSVTYNLHLDPNTLDPNFLVYQDSVNIFLDGCDAREIVQFLVYSTTVSVVEEDITLRYCHGEGETFNGTYVTGNITYMDTVSYPGVDTIFTVTGIELDELQFTSSLTKPCFGENNGTVSLSGAMGGQGPYEYSIDGVNFQTALDFDNLSVGLYTITIRDDFMCTEEVDVDLQSLEELLFDTDTEATCFGESNGEVNISAPTGGEGPYEYSIDGVNYQAGLKFENLPMGAQSITIRDSRGCTKERQVSVESLDEILATVQETKTCYGQTSGVIQIENVSGGLGDFEYSIDGINYQATPDFENLAANNYTIFIQDSKGCQVSLNTQIQESDELLLTLDGEESCYNSNTGTIEVSISGGEGAITYSLNGVNYQSANVFSTLASGSFDVYVKDELGCIAQQEIDIAEIEAIDFVLDPAMLNCDITETSLLVDIIGGQADVLWEDGSSDESLVVNTPGIYQVEISNACEQIIEHVEVSSELESTEGVYVPNAFSPNGDGINDNFCVLAHQDALMHNARLEIYDRWGSAVYQTDRPSEDWNGSLRSKTILPGVYVYMLELELEYCHEIKKISKKGEVTILR